MALGRTAVTDEVRVPFTSSAESGPSFADAPAEEKPLTTTAIAAALSPWPADAGSAARSRPVGLTVRAPLILGEALQQWWKAHGDSKLES